MQFLKEEIESKIIPSSKENGELTDYQYGHNIAYSVVLTLAQYLIEVEKEQIIDAYENGVGDENERNLSGKFTNAQEYYNQTYNQEPEKEYQPSEKYLKKQRELMEDFIWNKMNKNNQNK